MCAHVSCRVDALPHRALRELLICAETFQEHLREQRCHAGRTLKSQTLDGAEKRLRDCDNCQGALRAAVARTLVVEKRDRVQMPLGRLWTTPLRASARLIGAAMVVGQLAEAKRVTITNWRCNDEVIRAVSRRRRLRRQRIWTGSQALTVIRMRRRRRRRSSQIIVVGMIGLVGRIVMMGIDVHKTMRR